MPRIMGCINREGDLSLKKVHKLSANLFRQLAGGDVWTVSPVMPLPTTMFSSSILKRPTASSTSKRVAARCATEAERIVALLHDTVEDTDVTSEYLLECGFPQHIVDAVLSVTKRDGEGYEDFVARAKQNAIGRVVKIHDLEDNMDVCRLDEITDGAVVYLRKYLKAYHFLRQD